MTFHRDGRMPSFSILRATQATSPRMNLLINPIVDSNLNSSGQLLGQFEARECSLCF